MKDLLKMLDLSREEIFEILDLADQLKYNQRHGIPHRYLEGKSLAMIFAKHSTRTRVSFESGMFQLGGQAILLNARESQIERGEPVEDTARTLSRYCDGVMIRTYAQQEAEELAQYADIPVINGLTDFAHPCQVLADLMTIRERMATLDGVQMAFVGDGNNMANSLIVGGLKAGLTVRVATPEGLEPDASVLAFAKNFGDQFLLTHDPRQAVQNAEVVFTDAWTSMGREREEEERRAIFADYQLNQTLLDLAAPGAMVQHCLPAHRGEEITSQVFEDHADEIFEEAENRLHVQKAVLCLLMGAEIHK
jgi:ornithine carbamoyltransferase